MMTSRERFFRTLNYDQPDRLPVVIHVVPTVSAEHWGLTYRFAKTATRRPH